MSAGYSNGGHAPTSVATPRPVVSGQFLAKNRKSSWWRARLVLDILAGKVVVGDLCLKQVADLCRVDVSRVQRLRNGTGNGKTLGQRLARATPAELEEAARAIGPARIWDEMVIPIIEEDRARANLARGPAA
jgi:hypothetical protein